MKKCFKCGKEKNIDMFYRHRYMADGHIGKCIECAKIDANKTRKKNIEYYREYDRVRSSLPKRKKQSLDRYRKYPIMKYAHMAIYKRISDGRIKKRPCEICGSKDSVAHHDDYAKPLDIRWLCRSHHRIWHISNVAKNLE